MSSNSSKSSYEKINYSLRPAKAVERRMLCDVFARLYPFRPVHDYRYVGFGSIYFSDFQLIHRYLGITKMTSIERDAANAQRFEMNLPYACIALDFRPSGVVLPTLDWGGHSIVWLDYDGQLDSDVLADVVTTMRNLNSGSFIAYSFNAHPVSEPPEAQRVQYENKTGNPLRLPVYRKEQLEVNLPNKVPLDITGQMLDKKGLPKVLRRVLLAEINAALSVRNAQLPQEKQLLFKQVINLIYQDGCQMLTVGGVIVSAEDMPLFEACRFNDLAFFRDDVDSFAIRVPCLTLREMHLLNSLLPTDNPQSFSKPGLPAEDTRRYAEVYRYFPSYSETAFA